MNAELVVTLRLPIAHLEYIAHVLAQRPYGEVAHVMAALHDQLARQAVQEAPGSSIDVEGRDQDVPDASTAPAAP